MRTFIALPLLAITVSVGADATEVRAKADVSCRPAKESLHYDCVITLTNARTKAPLTGVTLMVGADMPSMPMAHNVRPVKAEAGSEPGTYRARLELEMTGVWAVRLDLSGPLRDRVVNVLRFEDDKVAPATAAGPEHKGHTHANFSAGEPGDRRRPAQVIQVVMREGDGKMMFVPDRLEIRKGDQVRFMLRNEGLLDHEFVLATTEENIKHAEEMKKNPDMKHDDPNARRVAPKRTSEIIWRFTKTGQFEFGCLIPGHREAGMTGIIIVK